MIDVYELARILPETLFGLAAYNHDTQTAHWETKHPTCNIKQDRKNPWSFKFATLDWFDAEGREYSFNNSEYTGNLSVADVSRQVSSLKLDDEYKEEFLQLIRQL